MGDRTAGGPRLEGADGPALPGRGPWEPAIGRLLHRERGPRLLAARQFRVRTSHPGDQPAHRQLGGVTEATESILEQVTKDEYPHLVEIGEHALRSEYSVDNEFEFGLDLILDALDRTMQIPGSLTVTRELPVPQGSDVPIHDVGSRADSELAKRSRDQRRRRGFRAGRTVRLRSSPGRALPNPRLEVEWASSNSSN